MNEEVERARSVGFFEYESHDVAPWKLTIQGIISHRRRYGGSESLRVRLEYGPGFPEVEPDVFDHDKVFTPIAKGHKFSNHALCLRFPYREEFSKDAALVTREVLQASLNWLVKRNIFERTGEWPGEAEEHGFAGPLKTLVLERAVATGNGYLALWVDVALEFGLVPIMDAKCPCQSGRPVKSCHKELGLLLSRAVWASQTQFQSGQKTPSIPQGVSNALGATK